MALLFVDGFDFYKITDVPSRYDPGCGDSMVAGRRGGQALGLGIDNDDAITKIISPAKSVLIAGVAAKIPAGWNWWRILQFRSGSTLRVRVGVDSNTGVVTVHNGSEVLATCDSPVRGNNWFHIAMEASFHQTDGHVKVAINGRKLIDVTGKNTNPGGTGAATADRVTVQDGGQAGDVYVCDDLYIADGEGNSGNALGDYGDLWVRTDYPDSDFSASWDRLSGSTNHEMVDEAVEDDDTTYNKSATPSATDLFGCPAISDPAAGSVLGVQVSAVVKKYGEGTRSFALVLKSGTAESEGSEVAPGASYQVYSHLVTADPDGGGAWDLTTAGEAEIGIRVKA